MNQSLKFTKQILASIVVAFQVAVLSFVPVVTSVSPAYSQAALLPNAKQQFLDQNGNPASNGRVYMYVPNTTTPKTTWQDSNQTIQNTNPVQLDAGGYATIYGQGSYQQRVVKSDNTQLWNAPTTAWNSAAPSGATGTDTAPVGSVLEWSGFTVPTNWAWANGQELDRTTYSDLLNAITISYDSVSCTSGSAILAGWPDTSQIRVGAPVEGSCVPTGTTVQSITSSSSITVSNNATATATVTARVFNYGNGNGVDTFNVIDKRGRSGVGPDCLGGNSCANRLQASTTINTTINSLTATVASVTNLSIGMVVITANIPIGSVITSISGTTVTFNNAATATASGTAATFQVVAGVNAPGASGGGAGSAGGAAATLSPAVDAGIFTSSGRVGGGSSSSSSGSTMTAARVSPTAPIRRRRARRLRSFSLLGGGMVEYGGDGVERTKDKNSITFARRFPCRRQRRPDAGFDRDGGVGGMLPQRVSQRRGIARTDGIRRAGPPRVDAIRERGEHAGGVLVGEHADHGEGAARHRGRPQGGGERTRGVGVVRDVDDDVRCRRDALETPGDACRGEPGADRRCVDRQRVPRRLVILRMEHGRNGERRGFEGSISSIDDLFLPIALRGVWPASY